jgi:murein DD-endopeptidase MepM/ murein hydrolase activator NlpD
LFFFFAVLAIGLNISKDVSMISPSQAAVVPPITTLLSLEPTGMAKPLADLRDYNGTYEGSIGSGTVDYIGSSGPSTLYRDNQDNGSVSGCIGEGCGSHPGVDIPIPSGTTVYAALEGAVVRSENNTHGWGGLIVIQSISPYTGETLFFTYAHLRERLVTGGWVSTGQLIGKSGGALSDPYRGNSTGAHLHFQIDKNDGNNEPWFPSAIGRSVNYPDKDFQVTAKTYNPIVFVAGGYRWSFNGPQERELWDLFNIQSQRWGVSNGALWIDGVGDTFIRRGGNTNCGRSRLCSSNFAAEASLYPRVFLDLYNVCLSNPGKIYFTTKEFPDWSEQRMVPYYPNSQGRYSEHIYMTQNQYWRGIITGLRVDPAEYCSTGDDPNYFGEITIER